MPEVTAIEKAAMIAEQVTHDEAVASVKSLRGNMAEEFMKLSSSERMDRFYSFRVQGLHYREAIPQDGPSSPGGSKSGKVKKSNKGNKIPIEAWTSYV